MATRHPTPETKRAAADELPRRRLALAGALLAITLAGGWAAGQLGGPASPLPGEGKPDGVHASAGPVHFHSRLDRRSVLQGGDGAFGVELVVAADALPTDRMARIPTDLVVVLDRSGSMQGKPLADALGSIRELIGRLGADDRFALVTYASDVALAIPLQAATPENRGRWNERVDRIGPGGGTNMAIGIELAADTLVTNRQAGRMPRVILLSDGHANEGDHSHQGLRARAGRAVAGEYVLSTVGVGQGFDEALMTALADAGTGNFYYVRDGSDLGEVFAGEFDSARETVASAVAVELDLGPGVELVDAAGYPIERAGRTARFRPGSLFAGQERRIWLTLRAPTDRLGDVDLGELRLAYRDPQASPGAAPRVLRLDEPQRLSCVADERQYAASLDEGLVVLGIARPALATLKLDVAQSLRDGSFDEARGKIEAYKARNRVVYGQLGLVQEEQDSFREAEALERELEEAFASPAAPAARNALSKSLAAQGQDARREGAKKQK